MTEKRAVLLGAVLLLAATTAGWAVTGAESQVQEESTSFDVTNLTAPPSVTAGETVTITAEVSYEPGDAVGTATPANETATEPTETGEMTGTEAGATATATDTGATTATGTETTATGTETTATGTATATPTAAGAVTQSVEFRVSGDVVERQDVTLAPGESTTVTFELDTTDVPPGVYIHGIYTEDFGEVATLIVTQPAAGGEETPTATETATPTANETATPGTETATPTAGGATETA